MAEPVRSAGMPAFGLHDALLFRHLLMLPTGISLFLTCRLLRTRGIYQSLSPAQRICPNRIPPPNIQTVVMRLDVESNPSPLMP